MLVVDGGWCGEFEAMVVGRSDTRTTCGEGGGGGDGGRGKKMTEVRETERGEKMTKGGAEVMVEEKRREKRYDRLCCHRRN